MILMSYKGVHLHAIQGEMITKKLACKKPWIEPHFKHKITMEPQLLVLKISNKANILRAPEIKSYFLELYLVDLKIAFYFS